MPKKIVQISATREEYGEPVCFTLCDDGSLGFFSWSNTSGWLWEKLPEIQDDKEKGGKDG